MAKKKYHVRKFLNKTKGIACIEVDANYTAWNFGCDVTLTDCNRRIDLDFNMWEAKAVKEKMDKLNLLIFELTNLRTYLEEATTDFIKLNTEANKKRGNKSILEAISEEEDD
jgi:hypothetical protein